MKLKDMVIGGTYAVQTRPGGWADRVVVLSHEIFRTSGRASGPDYVTHRRGDHIPYGTTTGLLVLEVRQELSDEEWAEVQKITLSDVLIGSPRYRNAPVRARAKLVQARHLVDEWDSFQAERKENERRTQEHREHQAQQATERLPRMQEVARVLELLDGNHYHVSEYGDNARLNVKLEDLEKLVKIAKVVVHRFREENAES